MSVTVTDSINCIGKLNVYMNSRAVLAARQIVIHLNRITQIVVIYLKSIELDLEDFRPQILVQYQQWTTRCLQWRCWSRSLNRPKKWQEPAALHSPSALSFSSAFGSRFGEQFIWLTETLKIVLDENLKFDTLLMIGNAYE